MWRTVQEGGAVSVTHVEPPHKAVVSKAGRRPGGKVSWNNAENGHPTSRVKLQSQVDTRDQEKLELLREQLTSTV